MTREEAIEVIKDIYNYTKWDTYTTNEARTIAINALEAIDKIKAEIEECLKVLEERDRISPKPIYSQSEFMERKETYKQCLRFINKHVGDTE